MAKTYGTFTSPDGKATMVAETPGDEVYYRFHGWKEADPDKPAGNPSGPAAKPEKAS